MKKLLALLALVASSVFADTTGNLIRSGTTHTWYGVTTGALPANYMPGGPAPIYDPSTNTITFSYGSASVGQTLAINQALAGVGAGVKISGYNYSYDVRNMNGDDRQPGVDTFTVSQLLRGPSNSVLLSSSQTHNTKFDWKTIAGTKTATTPYNIADTSYIQFGVSGMDSGYWGGYFGPQIRNVNMSLNYTVDPCAANPAYSPTCANYSTVNTSNNLVPNPTGYAVSGATINQSYAINQALSLSGANVMIHGFQWGYQANANGTYCASWLIVCWDERTPSVTTNVNITDSAGNSIHQATRNYQNSYNTTNYQYVFPSSRNLLTLGSFNFTASTNDAAYIGDMWSRALYTPDPCTVNPLSSTSCPNYAQAYHDQQCSVNPLYASTCAGYTVAYTTQQCNINPLYSQQCPGYAAAYQTQQCSISPLFSNQCPGYEQAYLTQQCNINQLYSNQCPGYQQAYLAQQCNISQLYSNQCSGYQQAYHTQQCSLNALYASDCPGYASAYLSQQCSINSLYSNQCPGYAVAYKNQQCGLNALYATDCPGYAAAYRTAQCTANPLYMSDCPGYQAAYLNQQCNISQLFSTQCPNYQTAYFNQQCSLNGLYDRTCPNYATAYAAKQVLSTPTVVATTTTTASEPAKVSVVSPTVESVLNVPSTTSATSPTSVTSVIAPAPTPAVSTSTTSSSTTTPAATASTSSTTTEQKKTDTAVGSIEKKSTNNADARKQAADKAKEVAVAAGNAKSLEDQAATQGLLVGLIGYVPGFNAYQNSLIPDTNALAMVRQYGKPVVDNRGAQRRLTGASDSKWQEMVDSQYQLGK